ncbi:MAG TPA: hypothetical protein VFW50_43710 [Streptosporangiaceae bacterium]|nr:hypothetical protein [Streptosporangiaceae bacterium]
MLTTNGGADHGGFRVRLDAAGGLEQDAADHPARAAVEQQYPVGGAGAAGPEVVGEQRHRGLERGADEERPEAAEHDHGDQGVIGPDVAQHPQRAQHPDPGRPRPVVAQVPGELRPEQEQRERQVDGDVGEDAEDRAQAEQQRRADHRTEQDPEAAEGGVEPHRTLPGARYGEPEKA